MRISLQTMFQTILKSNRILTGTTAFLLAVLIFMAYDPAWQYHLAVDVWGFYFPRFVHFLKNLSFFDIGRNEYLPGAMFFFLIPGYLIPPIASTWQAYLKGLIFINVILVIIHLYIYKQRSTLAPYLFLGILLFAGPIFFFRHDLFVSLFVIGSILLWQKKKVNLAAFTLGVATSIKIYPMLILPYFVILAYKSKNYLEVLKVTAFFGLGILLIFGVYILLGSSVSEIVNSLKVNSIKPVHVESIWGSLLTIIGKLKNGVWTPGLGSSGIFGIDPRFIYVPVNFYNYFWILPLGAFYIFIHKNVKKFDELRVDFIFLIILIFLLFSKILTAQYLFWLLPLFPLLKFTKKTSLIMVSAFVTILLIVFASQYIYPLHYNELLGIFYSSGQQAEYFYVLLIRNILLIILFFLILKYAKNSET